ncbi:hypothetical protein DFH09DRAFT_1067405 [Mycena vulgaris]|nr:hypothetical protein DFH09DRAFT_1067405 [Mycena vulgaris]
MCTTFQPATPTASQPASIGLSSSTKEYGAVTGTFTLAALHTRRQAPEAPHTPEYGSPRAGVPCSTTLLRSSSSRGISDEEAQATCVERLRERQVDDGVGFSASRSPNGEELLGASDIHSALWFAWYRCTRFRERQLKCEEVHGVLDDKRAHRVREAEAVDAPGFCGVLENDHMPSTMWAGAKERAVQHRGMRAGTPKFIPFLHAGVNGVSVSVAIGRERRLHRVLADLPLQWYGEDLENTRKSGPNGDAQAQQRPQATRRGTYLIMHDDVGFALRWYQRRVAPRHQQQQHQCAHGAGAQRRESTLQLEEVELEREREREQREAGVLGMMDLHGPWPWEHTDNSKRQHCRREQMARSTGGVVGSQHSEETNRVDEGTWKLLEAACHVMIEQSKYLVMPSGISHRHHVNLLLNITARTLNSSNTPSTMFALILTPAILAVVRAASEAMLAVLRPPLGRRGSYSAPYMHRVEKQNIPAQIMMGLHLPDRSTELARGEAEAWHTGGEFVQPQHPTCSMCAKSRADSTLGSSGCR